MIKFCAKLSWFGVIAWCLFTTIACSYKFASTTALSPYKGESVAVEAVYDTGKSVLPRAILWEELQKTIIKDGFLLLKEKSSARFLLRAHITKGEIESSGTLISRLRSNQADEILQSGQLPPPSDIADLNSANSYYRNSLLRVKVQVQMWDTYLNKIVFSNEQQLTEEFLNYDLPIEINTDFLLYHEKTQHDFRRIAIKLSESLLFKIKQL